MVRTAVVWFRTRGTVEPVAMISVLVFELARLVNSALVACHVPLSPSGSGAVLLLQPKPRIKTQAITKRTSLFIVGLPDDAWTGSWAQPNAIRWPKSRRRVSGLELVGE